MPSGNSNSSNMGTPPSNAQGQNGMQNQESETKMETSKCILLGVEGLIIAILITYMELSRFNKLTIRETLKSTATVTNSNLSIQTNSKYYKTAPMFFITNTDAIINLKNCKLSYGSNTLISSKGTTEWGTTGSNGGNLTLNAEDKTLEGNIEIDNISILKMNLTNSKYTGTINAENIAKQIDLKIDSNTKIKLTGNSYVTSLEDEDTTYGNIDFNEYTLYVNGTAIN